MRGEILLTHILFVALLALVPTLVDLPFSRTIRTIL